MKKRGFFFILDAMLGLFVLIIGVFLITSSYVSTPASTQVELLSDDLLNFLASTKIKDLNNNYAGIGGELWSNGMITDAENSLLQQTGKFYAKKQLGTADKFVQNVTQGIVPAQFMYEVWMNNELVSPKTPTQEHNDSKNKTRLLLTSKKITFGILNKTTSDIWGPYKAEVFVWEK